LAKTRKCRFDESEELDEEDLKEIENELIETRANALRSQINNDESSRGLNFEESKFHKGDDKNKYLNDASLSSNCMYPFLFLFINFVYDYLTDKSLILLLVYFFKLAWNEAENK